MCCCWLVHREIEIVVVCMASGMLVDYKWNNDMAGQCYVYRKHIKSILKTGNHLASAAQIWSAMATDWG